MNLTPTFLGQVNGDGKLAVVNRRAFTAYLSRFRNKKVAVSVAPLTNSRSQNQNRYYWGVVLHLIADHTGHTSEEIHEFLKRKFLPVQTIEVAGERFEYVRSTTTLDTIQFEDYLEQCRAWAAQELSIVVPMPGEINIDE